jgi:hypothetical protein
MSADSPRAAVRFDTAVLSARDRDALPLDVLAACPEAAEVTLKYFAGPGWAGAVVLRAWADDAAQRRLAGWLRGDARVAAGSVELCNEAVLSAALPSAAHVVERAEER